jgi:hypothetical protein
MAPVATQSTGQEPLAPPAQPGNKKNPAAVALGRLGASKGGRARAAALSQERRKEIAKTAARVRWNKVQQRPPDPVWAADSLQDDLQVRVPNGFQ